MDFKPGEFFIGLVEFITILLPGAVGAFIILLFEQNHTIEPNHTLLQYAFVPEKEIIFWVVFVFSSFGLGYFISSIASGLDSLFDVIRKQIYPYEENLSFSFKYNCLKEKQRSDYASTYQKSLDKLKEKKCQTEDIISSLDLRQRAFEGYKIKFRNHPVRIVFHFLIEIKWKIEIDNGFAEAKKLLLEQPDAVRNTSNTYKWATVILEANYPAICEQLTRMMAASKFFRSMVLAAAIFLILEITDQITTRLWQANTVILIFSFREYIVQRHKCLQKTYQSIVTLLHYKKDKSEDISISFKSVKE